MMAVKAIKDKAVTLTSTHALLTHSASSQGVSCRDLQRRGFHFIHERLSSLFKKRIESTCLMN